MAMKCAKDVELKDIWRFSDVAEEPLRTLASIQGYEQMPVVSLEETIEPLVSIVPDVERMVWTVKQNCHEPEDGLTSDESASIMLYSMEWEPREKSFCLVLNRILRGDDREKLKPWFLYLKLIMKSLSKLPSIDRSVYRGVRMDLSGHYPEGKTFVWWGFSSCTLSVDILENKHFLGKTGTRTRFKIVCHSGKDISRHAFQPSEDEILLLPARHFKVTSCLDSGNGLHIIQLKEIDPFPLLHPMLVGNIPSTKSPSASHSPANGPSRTTPFYSFVSKLTGSSTVHHNAKLEDIIAQCKSNSWVNLCVRELIDQDMSIVVQQAIIKKKCKALYLSGNEITSHGVSILAGTLRNNSTLEELDLAENRITDVGVEFLIQALSTNKSILEKLHLGSNGITDSGAQYLAEMLKTNRTLTHLMLRNNQIGNRGVHLLANALALHNVCLEVLSLSSNPLISDSSVDSLIIMLKHNQSLKALDVKNCNLSETSTIRLREATNIKKDFTLFVNSVENACILS